MVFLHASLIAVGTFTIATSATASLLVPEDSILGGRNGTTATTRFEATVAAAPKLFSYCGADIVGGDTFVKRYPSPDDCVANCLPSTGCNAGTWTKFEGGTCYFKRVTKAQISNLSLVYNADAVSFLLKDDTTPSEVPFAGGDVDMPGNDFANAPAADYNKCNRLCRDNARCNAWTWSPYQGGTCYLKTKTSPQVDAIGNVAGLAGHERAAAACLVFM